MIQATISREQLSELREVVEDAVQYVCDENIISGECAWTVLECLATAKLAQLRGQID